MSTGPIRAYRLGHREPGMLGRLMEADALRYVAEGYTTSEIADLAGVLPKRVSSWKSAHGLARPKRENGAA